MEKKWVEYKCKKMLELLKRAGERERFGNEKRFVTSTGTYILRKGKSK
jgi:hypothetical protein